MNSIKQRMKNIKSEPFFFHVNKKKEYKQTNKQANRGYEQFRNEIKTIEKVPLVEMLVHKFMEKNRDCAIFM